MVNADWGSGTFHTEGSRNIYQLLLEGAEKHPNRPYLYSPQGSVSYEYACAISSNLAKHLGRQHELAENPVLVASIGSAEKLLFLTWACLAAGICLTPLPPTKDPGQAKRTMNRLGSDALATDIPELAGEAIHIPFEYFFSDDPYHESQATGCGDEIASVESSTPAFLFPTSGSTGEPKWIKLSHGLYLSALERLAYMDALKNVTGQVIYITPPLSHAYGMNCLLKYTKYGKSLVLPQGSSPLGATGELLNSYLANLITTIEGVPDFYAQMSRLGDKIKLPALEHIGLGGGAVNQDVLDYLTTAHPGLKYSVTYGMTEAPPCVSQKVFAPPYQEDHRSSGKVLPLWDVRIVNEEGAMQDLGKEGEIHIKGDLLALPYYGENEVFEEFFATGDTGYFNKDHELCVTGRQSQFLKLRGYRISPEQVESVLNTLEYVQESRVSMLGEKLVAEVVRSNHSLSGQQLLANLSSRLPNYSIPEDITFVQAIPRTASGKVKRQ